MAGTFELRDPRFASIVPEGARIEQVATGFGFTERPLWDDHRLLFSELRNSRIWSWQPGRERSVVRTFREPSNIANGLTLDHQRRLLACEGGARRLTRTEPDGSITVLAERHQGQRLNSPNDVVVASHGAIYFSDPFWAHSFDNPPGPRVRPEDRELPFAGVFRLDPDGTLALVADDFEVPDGLALSPDERTLYVDDSRRGHVRAFDVRPDGTLASGRIFAVLEGAGQGIPDAMKVDREGNVYCTGPGGMWVLAPDGVVLGRILPPELPAANVARGDAD